MEYSKKNLEEDLEQIVFLTEERHNLKDRYKDVKVFIDKLKDKINDLEFGKESIVKTSENEILKYEWKVFELKLSLKRSGIKN